MTHNLDVLLSESHPGIAAAAVAALEADGHRVHRCFDDGANGSSRYGCSGMGADHSCPADAGLDVALVVRRGVQPHATATEAGVRCAVRAGIPIVEHGTELLDPFADWVTVRAGDDVVAAVREATGLDAVIADVRARIAPLLVSAGLSEDSIAIRLDRTADRLTVHLTANQSMPSGLGQLIGVRALDAIRATDRQHHRSVGVQVHDSEGSMTIGV